MCGRAFCGESGSPLPPSIFFFFPEQQNMWDLATREGTHVPSIGSAEALPTGPPGKSQALNFMVLPMILIHSVNLGLFWFSIVEKVYPKL